MTTETNSRTSETFITPPPAVPFRAYLASSVNVWGNPKRDINPDEYCQNCEQDVRRGHYSFCPTLGVGE